VSAPLPKHDHKMANPVAAINEIQHNILWPKPI
jgi:hypothetical protein